MSFISIARLDLSAWTKPPIERDHFNKIRFARIFPGSRHAQRKHFVWRKTISRDDVGAVAAEDDAFRFFRKHSASRFGAEQDDSYFFCDPSAAAVLLPRPVDALGIGRMLRRSNDGGVRSLAVRMAMRWNAMGNARFERESEELT
jgi:hypothetical protein